MIDKTDSTNLYKCHIKIFRPIAELRKVTTRQTLSKERWRVDEKDREKEQRRKKKEKREKERERKRKKRRKRKEGSDVQFTCANANNQLGRDL